MNGADKTGPGSRYMIIIIVIITTIIADSNFVITSNTTCKAPDP